MMWQTRNPGLTGQSGYDRERCVRGELRRAAPSTGQPGVGEPRVGCSLGGGVCSRVRGPLISLSTSLSAPSALRALLLGGRGPYKLAKMVRCASFRSLFRLISSRIHKVPWVSRVLGQ